LSLSIVGVQGAAPSFSVGDQVDIVIQSPFAPSEGVLLTKCNGRILHTRTFHMAKETTTMNLLLADEYAPSIDLEVGEMRGKKEIVEEINISLTLFLLKGPLCWSTTSKGE
jgi:hypothetical protein